MHAHSYAIRSPQGVQLLLPWEGGVGAVDGPTGAPPESSMSLQFTPGFLTPASEIPTTLQATSI